MSLTFKAHPYQQLAINFLIQNESAGLFLDTGLGKTAVTLQSIKLLKMIKGIKGVLLVAPLSIVKGTWQQEIDKFTNFKHLKTFTIHGKFKADFIHSKADIFLINPEGLTWLQDFITSNKKVKLPFNVLWIDESTKFKNSKSGRFKILKNMIKADIFNHRYIMTGTPASNGLQNLWSQIWLLDRGESLGKTYTRFSDRYFKKGGYMNYELKQLPGAEESIYKSIDPLILNLKLDDPDIREYLKMPDLIFNNRYVYLDTKARKSYEEMEKDFFIELEGKELTASATISMMSKIHQIANGSIYEDLDMFEENKKNRQVIDVHNHKTENLFELIEELNGKSLLVAYKFKHDLANIKSMLDKNKIKYDVVTTKNVDKVIKTFNNGDIQVLLGNPKSMAHGLNLQKNCNDVCFFSLDWSLEDYKQTYARVYRQGVKGSLVKVHHIITDNTIDNLFLNNLETKDKIQKDLRQALSDYRLKKGS